MIPEHAAKGLLARAGIPIPAGAFVTDLQAARQAAARIGYPVALKAQAAALAHKSDIGGVILRIADEAALAHAWRQLHADVASARPELALDGVLVEAMVRPGIELIVGARVEPGWGPVLVIGLGGIWAEALQDVRVLPPDLAADAIVRELHTLRAAALLTDFRGSPACDLDAVAEIASRLGRFVLAHPEIAEVDINPLIVHPQREGAVAVDALIVVR